MGTGSSCYATLNDADGTMKTTLASVRAVIVVIMQSALVFLKMKRSRELPGLPRFCNDTHGNRLRLVSDGETGTAGVDKAHALDRAREKRVRAATQDQVSLVKPDQILCISAARLPAGDTYAIMPREPSPRAFCGTKEVWETIRGIWEGATGAIPE